MLELVHDQEIGLDLDWSRRSGVQGEELGVAGGGEHDVVRHLELTEHGPVRRDRSDGCVRARNDDDLILAVFAHEDERDPGRADTFELEVHPRSS